MTATGGQDLMSLDMRNHNVIFREIINTTGIRSLKKRQKENRLEKRNGEKGRSKQIS